MELCYKQAFRGICGRRRRRTDLLHEIPSNTHPPPWLVSVFCRLSKVLSLDGDKLIPWNDQMAYALTHSTAWWLKLVLILRHENNRYGLYLAVAGTKSNKGRVSLEAKCDLTPTHESHFLRICRGEKTDCECRTRVVFLDWFKCGKQATLLPSWLAWPLVFKFIFFPVIPFRNGSVTVTSLTAMSCLLCKSKLHVAASRYKL